MLDQSPTVCPRQKLAVYLFNRLVFQGLFGKFVILTEFNKAPHVS